MRINPITKPTLEIYLTKNELEHIANGYEVAIKCKSSEFERVVIKASPVNDLVNPLINHDIKLISQRDLEVRDLARDSMRSSFGLGG